MKNTFIKFFALIFVGLILLLTLKGVKGNPTPEEIYSNLQSETKPFELSPERGRFALTQSVIDNRSVYFSVDIAKYVVPDLGYANGHYVSLFAPGVSYLTMPLYTIGKNLNLSQVFSFSTSTIFALVNAFLIIDIVKKLTKNWNIGFISGIAFLFTSSSWAYGVTLYQHHITTFLILLSLRLVFSKANLINAFILGSLFSLSIFVEYPNAVFFIPIIFSFLLNYFDISEKGNKTNIKVKYSILGFLFGLVLLLIPTFVYNQKAYGNPFQLAGTVQGVHEINYNSETGKVINPEEVYDEKTVSGFFVLDKLPNSLSVLLTSKDRGLLYFSPFVLFAIFGLIPLYKRNKKIYLTILGVIFVIFSLYGMWGDPWGGWAFGPRYLIPVVSLACILLGVAIDEYGKRVRFFIPFSISFTYSLFVNAAGALTTIQIPPSVEVDSLRYPKPTYLYNIDLIMKGKSSSFLYNEYFSRFLELKYYALIIVSVILILFFVNYFLAIRNKRILN